MVISGPWLTADQKSRDSAEIFSPVQNHESEFFLRIKNWRRLSSGVDLLTGVRDPHCAKLGHSPCPCQRKFAVRVRFKSLKKHTVFEETGYEKLNPPRPKN